MYRHLIICNLKISCSSCLFIHYWTNSNCEFYFKIYDLKVRETFQHWCHLVIHSCTPNSVYLFLHANSYASETKLPALVCNLDSFKEIKAIEINISYMYFSPLLTHDLLIWISRGGKLKVPEWVDLVKTAKRKELAPYDPDWYYIRAGNGAVCFFIVVKEHQTSYLISKNKSSYRTRNIFCKLKRCSPKLCRASSLKKICMEDIFGQWYLIFCEWKFTLNSLKTI